MDKSTLFVFFLMLSLQSHAQDLLICLTDPEDPVNQNSRFGFFDIEACTDSVPNYEYPEAFSGLTYHPADIVFSAGEDFLGQQGLFDLFRINVSLVYFSQNYQGTDSIQTLACDYNGILYAARNTLISYDYFADQYNNIGDLPPGMSAQGDMTFREGNLYLTTESHTIIQLDTDNPMNSIEIMTIPEEIRPITGLTTYPYRCDSIITYAVQRLETTSILYILDFDTQTFTEICTINYPIRSMASPIECKIPPCEMYVDLDTDDSSEALHLDFQTANFCTTPIAIADADVDVFSILPIDSILIELTGILNPGQEYLELLAADNMSVIGSGSTAITLINNGAASFEDFEVAIEAILFHNSAANINPGPREAVFQIFSDMYFSEISTSFIGLQNNLMVDIQAESPSCYGDSDGSLSISLSGGLPPYNLSWEDGTSANLRENLSAGTYTLNLSDSSGCTFTEVIPLTEPDLLQVTIQSNVDTVCSETAILNAFPEGGTAPYVYAWSNGPETAENAFVGPGNYEVTVVDSNACLAVANVTLFSYDTIFVDQFESLCAGESFNFDGQFFSTDTTYCAVYNNLTGCDSIHCLTLEFLDTALVQEQQLLCFGESLTIDNITLDSDTTACFVYIGQNGCDSTYCLSLTLSGGSTTFSESICAGESYTFNDMLLTETGLYADTFQNQDACDSIVLLDLLVHPAPNPVLNPIGSLCNGEEVEISTGVFEQYSWSTGASEPSISVQTAGIYGLSVIDNIGCEGSAEIEITDGSIEAVGLENNNPSCFGESDGSITITEVMGGAGPFSYSIDGQTFQQSNEFEGLAAANYTIQIEDVHGCTFELGASLQEPNPLEIYLGETILLSLGDSLQLSFSVNFDPAQIEWSTSESISCDTCRQPILRPINSTAVVLTLTNEQGCSVSAEQFITVDQSIGIYIPSAFSPNDDGVNDTFSVYTDNSISKIIAFRIFNRWGDLLHEVMDTQPDAANISWNGTYRGKQASQGIYVYSLQVLRLDGETEMLGGDFVLIR